MYSFKSHFFKLSTVCFSNRCDNEYLSKKVLKALQTGCDIVPPQNTVSTLGDIYVANRWNDLTKNCLFWSYSERTETYYNCLTLIR